MLTLKSSPFSAALQKSSSDSRKISRSAIRCRVAPPSDSQSESSKLEIKQSGPELLLPSRRALSLLGIGAASSLLLLPSTGTARAAADKREMISTPVTNLSTFQKNAQRSAFSKRVQVELANFVSIADGPDLARLLLAEASTFDTVTRKGGFDGSIFLCAEEEARYPELRAVVDKLREAKAAIDRHPLAEKTGPISYADLAALGAKVALQMEWADYRLRKAGKKADKAQIISQAYGNDASWSATFGRQDESECPPVSRLPARDAPPEEIFAFFNQLGNVDGVKPGGLFTGKPPFYMSAYLLWMLQSKDQEAEGVRLAAAVPAFASAKTNIDGSKRTTTRVNYEVGTIEAWEKLTRLGAKIDRDAYLYAELAPKLRL